MLRLRTFGGVALADDGRPLIGAAVQRRRLALLAVLAAAGERGMSREKLGLLLWPESDARRVRSTLAQLLYLVRHELDRDPITAGAAELRLDPAVITSDVGDFDAAITAGNREEAIELYRGPFLDGFHLGAEPEFERWLDQERRHRAGQLAAALESLADECARRGKHASAVERRRQLAALDPLDSRAALALMQALDGAGNRPGALQHARVHESLVRDQLGIAPDRAVLAFAAELRVRAVTDGRPVPPVPPLTERTAWPAPPNAGAPTARTATPATPPPADAAGIVVVDSEPRPRRAGASSSARRRRGRLTAVGVAVLGAAGLLAVLRSPPTAPAAATAAWPRAGGEAVVVAVLPFDVRGPAEYGYLGDGLAELLSTNLNGAGDLRAVDSRALLNAVARHDSGAADPDRARAVAQRFGAQLFVLGNVMEAGGRLRISATLYERGPAPRTLARASAEGDATALFSLVDGLTAELLVGRYQKPGERLTQTAAVTTHSMPALKAYLIGEGHLRAARYTRAIDAFQRAVADDSTFALAYYRLSAAAEWAGRLELEIDAADQAMRHSGRLSEHDRLLVAAFHARRRGASDEAERLYRTIVARYPDDVEAWFQLGEVLFHGNAYRGRPFAESADAWRRVLALEPNEPGALLHLLRIAARERRTATFDSLYPHALAVASPAERFELRTTRAFAFGGRADQDRAIEDLRSADDAALWLTTWRLAVYTHDLAGAERIARLLIDPARPAATRTLGREALMQLLVARGRPRAAAVEGALIPRPAPWTTGPAGMYLTALGFAPTDRDAAGGLRERFRRWDAPVAPGKDANLDADLRVPYRPLRSYVIGLLSVRLGETGVARAQAAVLDTMETAADGALPRLFAAVLRGDAARAERRLPEALAALERTRLEIPIELAGPLGAEGYAAWLRAELLRESGRDDEALGWYATRADLYLNELVYLAPSHERLGRLYERRGDRAAAAAHLARFIELWRDCEPELRPAVAAAERRLERLRGAGAPPPPRATVATAAPALPATPAAAARPR